MSIVEFLLTRIAEDEAAAQVQLPRLGVPPEAWEKAPGQPRLLAECEAKRRIVEEHPPFGLSDEYCNTCSEEEWCEPMPCPTIRALAAIWQDHPDYREEWRP